MFSEPQDPMRSVLSVSFPLSDKILQDPCLLFTNPGAQGPDCGRELLFRTSNNSAAGALL